MTGTAMKKLKFNQNQAIGLMDLIAASYGLSPTTEEDLAEIKPDKDGLYHYGPIQWPAPRDPPGPMKKCTHCGQEKPKPDFYRTSDGLQSECRLCSWKLYRDRIRKHRAQSHA